eukprot:CAMPEP_0117450008 /NCGR_PEP_ID=MMETSP0759-20121206/8243_1 /TAXON_ID=63605 /ORGANISM="Percolomonas cosmopolitus, Strain WS" /LENGTH=411 /DNA_ID=CAMNT_0005242509 /DNA_START=340 /DNA_END=1575 /DNA_ORIENTATION=+
MEILSFLLHLYRPSLKLPHKYETPEDRVKYFRFVGEFVYKELRIKLKLKCLYESDGLSVREMLKIAREVFRAQKVSATHVQPHDTDFKETQFIDNVKTMKRMTSQITELGVKLHDLIQDESSLKQQRSYVINQHHNIDYIRRDVEQKNAKNMIMVENLMQSIQEFQQQQMELEAIKKRRVNEYERTKRRLERLSQYKPAHLDELEVRENDMQLLFDQYAQGCRNLEFLQYELQRYQEAEADELRKNQQKIETMRQRLYKQEQKQMFEIASNNGSDEGNTSSDEDVVRAPSSPSDRGVVKNHYAKAAIANGGGAVRQQYGGENVERQISRRPTSRRRPQSSNLYGTEKKQDSPPPPHAPQGNSMYISEDDETTSSEYSDERSMYSTEEESGELGDETGSEISGSATESDDEI